MVGQLGDLLIQRIHVTGADGLLDSGGGGEGRIRFLLGLPGRNPEPSGQSQQSQQNRQDNNQQSPDTFAALDPPDPSGAHPATLRYARRRILWRIGCGYGWGRGIAGVFGAADWGYLMIGVRQAVPLCGHCRSNPFDVCDFRRLAGI